MYTMDIQAERQKSVAKDADTTARNLQFKMTMMTNLFMSGTAMSDTQAGGKVLDNNSEYSSHRFWNVYIESLRKWQRKNHPKDQQQQPHHDAQPGDPSDDELKDEIDLFDDAGELCGSEFDTSIVLQEDDGRKKVTGMTHHHINYVYRGVDLADMSPLE